MAQQRGKPQNQLTSDKIIVFNVEDDNYATDQETVTTFNLAGSSNKQNLRLTERSGPKDSFLLKYVEE